MKNNIVIAVLSVILAALVAAIVLVGAGIIDFGITERTEEPNDDQTEDTAEIIVQPSDLPVSVSPYMRIMLKQTTCQNKAIRQQSYWKV